MPEPIFVRSPKRTGTAAPVRWPKPPSKAEQVALLARLDASSRKLDATMIHLAIRAAMEASDVRVRELLAESAKLKRRSRRPRAAFPWFD